SPSPRGGRYAGTHRRHPTGNDHGMSRRRSGATTEQQPPRLSLLSDDDLYLFNEGTHVRLWERLGAHPVAAGAANGTYFAVWAPNARSVSVIGDFNGWDPRTHPLTPRHASGIWEGFVDGVGKGAVYKFHVVSSVRGYRADKADPFARYSEVPPKTGS